jgi:hypothetical protein
VDYCNYPTVLKQKTMEKHKEYNLRYLLAKWGKSSDRLRQRTNKCNKNRVGRLPTSERNCKIILSDKVRHRIGKGWKKEVFLFFPPSYWFVFQNEISED